jgi:hypothetical protein
MKKFTLLFATSFIGAFSFAQTIPNAGFETWVNNNESPHTYSVPQGWITLDAIESDLHNAFGDPTYVANSVTQAGSPHGGSSAVQMAVVQSNEGDTIAGAIFSEPSANNFLNVAFGSGGAMGYAFASRPANLTGFRKFTISGGDSATVGVVMTKWNTMTNMRDTLVNIQNYFFTTPANAWTSFSIPLSYSSSAFPDTCIIFAGIVAPIPHPGTIFTIDDLAFTGLIGINEAQNNQATVSVFPNPFNNQATLSFTDVTLNHASLEMYDVLGNKVRVITDLNGEDVILNRDGLSDGMYFYNLVNDGKVIANGKLSIQ